MNGREKYRLTYNLCRAIAATEMRYCTAKLPLSDSQPQPGDELLLQQEEELLLQKIFFLKKKARDMGAGTCDRNQGQGSREGTAASRRVWPSCGV